MSAESKEPSPKIPAESLRYVVLTLNPNSEYANLEFRPDKAKELVEAYCHLRHRVFTGKGMSGYYPDGMDDYDRHPDTVFIVALDGDNTVLGGRRVMVHKPGALEAGSDKEPYRLKIEKNIDIGIPDMLWHLGKQQVQNMLYCELGGICKDPGVKDFAPPMYRATFDLLRRMNPDFFVASAAPTNIKTFTEEGKKQGVEQWYPLRSMLIPEGACTGRDIPLMDGSIIDLYDAPALQRARIEIENVPIAN